LCPPYEGGRVRMDGGGRRFPNFQIAVGTSSLWIPNPESLPHSGGLGRIGNPA
jgi:hypothetical protein